MFGLGRLNPRIIICFSRLYCNQLRFFHVTNGKCLIYECFSNLKRWKLTKDNISQGYMLSFVTAL